MPIIEWSSKMSVDIPQFDNQHRRLLDMINDLHDAMKQRRGNEVVVQILDQLVEYTQQHFTAEERLFIKYGYPSTDTHSKEHNLFISKVASFQNDIKQGRVMLSLKVMDFLKDWLVNHIQSTDKKYSSFLLEKGVS